MRYSQETRRKIDTLPSWPISLLRPEMAGVSTALLVLQMVSMCYCSVPYAYFVPYAYGMTRTRIGRPIHVWEVFQSHTRMGILYAYGAPYAYRIPNLFLRRLSCICVLIVVKTVALVLYWFIGLLD